MGARLDVFISQDYPGGWLFFRYKLMTTAVCSSRRVCTFSIAILIGGAFMVGHANAQYYRYPPKSPYAQPPYGPPRYAMPPDMDDDYPMYDPREDGGYPLGAHEN